MFLELIQRCGAADLIGDVKSRPIAAALRISNWHFEFIHFPASPGSATTGLCVLILPRH